MTRPDARPPDPGTWLLDRLDTREQALTRQIEETQTDIDSLTARLSELSQEAEHLRISRKTLLSLAEADPAPAEPDAPPLVGFDHPDYQQILTVFSETGGSLRARDLALAMDLPLTPNGIQTVRAKLKRLTSRGILIETEPGLFTQPGRQTERRPIDQQTSSNRNDEKGVSSRNALQESLQRSHQHSGLQKRSSTKIVLRIMQAGEQVNRSGFDEHKVKGSQPVQVNAEYGKYAAIWE